MARALTLRRNLVAVSVGLFCLALSGFYLSRGPVAAQTDETQKREDLYRLNNVGVALMEQFKHEEAAATFKQALSLDPGFQIARANLALADFFQRDLIDARKEALAVLKVDANNIRMLYVLGLIDKAENKADAAIDDFERVIKQDPADVGTNVNLGQAYSTRLKYDLAVGYFRKALEAEPYNATAAYSLATSLLRLGKRDEGQQMMATFQKLRASGYATSMGNIYFEQGRYSEAVTTTGAEPELVSKATPDVHFGLAAGTGGLIGKLSTAGLASALGRKITQSEFASETTKKDLIAAFGGSVGFFDYDNDGYPDAYVVACDSSGKEHNRLFHNDGKGGFTDVTDKAGVGLTALGMGAVFGDYDNDGKPDILVINYGPPVLYHNNGDGTFTDVSAKAGLPTAVHWTMTAAFVDYDHDGDLDIFLGNFADMSKWPGKESAIFPDDFAGDSNILLRNNGDGTFTDVTAKAGVGGGIKKTTAIVCTDFNNQRDIDMYVVNYGSPNQLLSNQRDGTFKDVAADRGVADGGKGFGVAVGDINKDGFSDFYVPHIDGPDVLYLSDGRTGFTKKVMPGSSGFAAQFIDYDNDGLIDVLTLGRNGFMLQRNLGNEWADVSAAAGLGAVKDVGGRLLASVDIDSDGGIDLITDIAGKPSILHNDGAAKNGWVAIDLRGATSNKSGIGSKVDIRSGSLQQKYETYASTPMPGSASLVAGLGRRSAIDAVRVTWPSGVVQSELGLKLRSRQEIKELDRKGTSCPLLYAWNGAQYQFITDFLGGSAIGALEQPGEYNYPDTDEYIRVTGDQLRERDGKLSIKVNNQLEEVIYFDALKLLAVDHPAETDVYPDEKLLPAPPYPPFKIFSVKNAHPPISASDNNNQNILPSLTNIDRSYPNGFKLLPFKGYAENHSITLDLGPTAKTAHPLLLLTAWIDYADSSSNLAAAQAGARLTPPFLQVKDKAGEWQTVIPEMGFPAGLPKTMTVDLTGKFIGGDTQVRIVTSMRIYWDQILVAESDGGRTPNLNASARIQDGIRTTMLPSIKADLHWIGFPHEYSPDGRKPLIYDYQKIETSAPWKTHLGNYTRLGDVTELLQAPDDMYVITRNGDEIQLDFDATKLPPLPNGWKRDYLVYANGFGKDMDINSARPDTVGPLPFHKMTAYPYPANEHYPMDEGHRAYLEKYNTRTITR